jgi:dihydroorotate dehydrogenase (fumarate)
MANTDTSYLGLRLPHPFVAGASPFGYHLDTIRRLEDAGVAAIVLHSLFEEQITMMSEGRVAGVDPLDSRFADAIAEFPDADGYAFTPEGYAEHIVKAKKAVNIPIIASLNGTSPENWLRFARIIEQAGADALEINPYEVVTNLGVPGTAIERRAVDIVRDLKRLIRIPIAVKLSPFFSAFANVARQLDQAGADALVLFNRFYQPDIDIRTMKVTPTLDLSTSAELRLRLRWVAILFGRVRPSLAVTGGVATPDDGIKAILAGADVVQLVSALLLRGPMHVVAMRTGLERWLDWHKAASLDQVRGRCSLQHASDPRAFERAQYIRTLHSWAG